MAGVAGENSLADHLSAQQQAAARQHYELMLRMRPPDLSAVIQENHGKIEQKAASINTDNAARRETSLGKALQSAKRERTTSRDTLRRSARASQARMSSVLADGPVIQAPFEIRVRAPSQSQTSSTAADEEVTIRLSDAKVSEVVSDPRYS